MNLYSNDLYTNDIDYECGLSLPWNKLQGKSVMISGATGLVGSFFVDVLMSKNIDCKVYALSRNEDKARARFSKWGNNNNLQYIQYDINKPFVNDTIGNIDYVLHLASNTHPMQYSTDPIGTITTNIIGLQNMLEFSVAHNATRFAFASSNEIYGENRGDTELFSEEYCGYIIIPRITRSYGPTMLMSDTKAISQFIKKGIAGEDIILKSTGTQYYSYQYVADTVSGLLTILLCGKSGEAYNIAAENSDIMMKDLASIIAEYAGRKVVFEIPDAVEAAGYSKATKARLDGSKLMSIGWSPRYDIRTGLKRTLDILKTVNAN